jgi:hypothetical protein
MRAFVEKKTGFEGNRTFIQGGFWAWCKAGSILAQDMVANVNPGLPPWKIPKPKAQIPSKFQYQRFKNPKGGPFGTVGMGTITDIVKAILMFWKFDV